VQQPLIGVSPQMPLPHTASLQVAD